MKSTLTRSSIFLKQTIKNYLEYKGAMKGIISFSPQTKILYQASRSAWESQFFSFSVSKLESIPSEFLFQLQHSHNIILFIEVLSPTLTEVPNALSLGFLQNFTTFSSWAKPTNEPVHKKNKNLFLCQHYPLKGLLTWCLFICVCVRTLLSMVGFGICTKYFIVCRAYTSKLKRVSIWIFSFFFLILHYDAT